MRITQRVVPSKRQLTFSHFPRGYLRISIRDLSYGLLGQSKGVTEGESGGCGSRGVSLRLGVLEETTNKHQE